MAVTQADARVELVEQLDLHVRDLVRRQGVEPQRDSLLVRRIIVGEVRAEEFLDLLLAGEGRVENDNIETESIFERYERAGIDIHGLLNEPLTGAR